MPGSVAVSIDILVSICKDHTSSKAISSIIKTLRRRRNPCVVFTQAAKTKSATAFWEGKLTSSKRASVMVALANVFDNEYAIYEDAKDMALFLN